MPSQQQQKEIPLNREYLLSAIAASGAYASYMGVFTDFLQSLPRHVDDVERDFGLDIYDKMMHDDAVSSAINTIKTQVLSSGVRLTGRIAQPPSFRNDREAQAKFDQSEAIKTECEEMLDGLQQSMESILSDMLDCLPYGHSLAEAVYNTEGGKLKLAKLRVKSRMKYSFVVDSYLDVKGAVPVEQASSYIPDMTGVVPKEKLFLLSYASQGGDPRGQSILRPAYNWWYLKQQICPHYLKYLVQFATPSLVGNLPPNAQDEIVAGQYNSDGSPKTISAAQVMAAAMQGFQNASVIAIENEAAINKIEMTGNGEAYLQAFDAFDRRITRTINITARATMEAQHASKADSESSQDILGSFIGYLRRMVETEFFRQVLQRVVAYNYGDDISRELAPVLVLSDVQQEDLVEYGKMIAMLAGAGFLHIPSQAPGIDAKLNLPERDMDAMQAEQDAKEEQAMERARQYGNLTNPLEGANNGGTAPK